MMINNLIYYMILHTSLIIVYAVFYDRFWVDTGLKFSF